MSMYRLYPFWTFLSLLNFFCPSWTFFVPFRFSFCPSWTFFIPFGLSCPSWTFFVPFGLIVPLGHFIVPSGHFMSLGHFCQSSARYHRFDCMKKMTPVLYKCIAGMVFRRKATSTDNFFHPSSVRMCVCNMHVRYVRRNLFILIQPIKKSIFIVLASRCRQHRRRPHFRTTYTTIRKRRLKLVSPRQRILAAGSTSRPGTRC